MTWEELKEKALELGYEYKQPAYAGIVLSH